jgi:ABC-type lipoprotein export system ATPase subunit
VYGNRTDYTGEVLIDDRQVSKFTHLQWATLRQKHVAMVFQDLRLFPDFTGWENLYLKLRLTNYCNKADVEAMAQRLGVVGLLK